MVAYEPQNVRLTQIATPVGVGKPLKSVGVYDILGRFELRWLGICGLAGIIVGACANYSISFLPDDATAGRVLLAFCGVGGPLTGSYFLLGALLRIAPFLTYNMRFERRRKRRLKTGPRSGYTVPA